MISVIIPTLNEADTIQSVVRFAFAQPNVSEVIVVDDKSLDKTVQIAAESGAKVISSSKLGKGASMREGLLYAQNEVVIYLDGDINPYPHDTIQLLAKPILENIADFTKANFSRNAGRVTEILAKPLLSIFFPELMSFNQPLSGMIGVRKSMVSSLDFKDDYGVDLGLLIDAYVNNLRLQEVFIGYIENKSKPWNALSKMSKEVAMTIISKASTRPNTNYNLELLTTLNAIRSQLDIPIQEHVRKIKKIIFFDMDHTLLAGSFIQHFIGHFNLSAKYEKILSEESDLVIITKRIANLLRGVTLIDILNLVDTIPIVSDAKDVIAELKKKNYLVGIVSHSFDVVVNHIKNKLGMDFSLGHELEFSKSICTGEVKIPSFYFKSETSLCNHSICKTHAMQKMVSNNNILVKNSVAVGDSTYDLCMIRQAGIGVSFCTHEKIVEFHSDINIYESSFRKLLTI